jgi:CheY-like chemotaxis protein
MIDLRDVLNAAIEATRPVLAAAGHRLDVDLPDDPLMLVGDTDRLTQVFANLLNNAAKYTNGAGRIALTAQREPGHAVVRVHDDGVGIEPRMLSAIFDKFTQVDRHHRRTQGGLGIGLTLVRSLVMLHGGTVEAVSQGPNTGADFIVSLPVVEERTLRRSDGHATNNFPARRILVVDDNHDASDSLGTLLEALGATPCVAHSGSEALDALDLFKPDAMLLDIGMPGMDGYEVARQIRSNPRHRHLFIVALTGWGQDDDRRRSKDAGIDHHLVKPPDIPTLRTLLERRKAQRHHA